MAKQQTKKRQNESNVSSTHPVLCPNGKYRWVYDIPMLTNPSILLEVYKVLVISFGLVWLFVLLIGSCEGHLRLADVWETTRNFLLLIAVFFVIGYVAYFFVAWHYGWKYSVLFIMDEHEVVHKQLPGTEGKVRAIGKLTALAGVAGGKPGMVGLGILAANRTSMSTSLDSVRRLILWRRMNLIRVHQRFSQNLIYAADEDLDFVYEFLCQHCPNARKKKLEFIKNAAGG